ncbi:MAG: hypothetical protein MJZ30_09395 [Paludibacteraceae bacterium]|nr:hypothetical protein [Paludibacteraceae bacterium]
MSNCNDTIKGKDKIYHLVLATVLSIIHPIVGVLASFAKEVYDSRQSGNHWCWKDLLADTIGILVGGAVHYLIF